MFIQQKVIEDKVRRDCVNVAEVVAGDNRFDTDTANLIAGRIRTRGTGSGYYQLTQLPEETGIETVRTIFKDGADEMNWLFLSTSGIHGSYTTLDDIEADIPRLQGNCWESDHEPTCECGAEWDDDNHTHVYPDGRFRITVLIVKPRIVQTQYGTIYAHVDDIPWLRKAATESVASVAESQGGNT